MIYRDRKRGFSVIEILITVSIVIIFSSVVYASLNESRKKSRDAVRMGDLKSLSLAAERYFSEHFEFPATYEMEASLNEYFTGGIPKDPLDDVEEGWYYNYKSYDEANGAHKYCFLAKLETSSAAVIQDPGDNPCYSAPQYGHNYVIKGP